MTRKLEQLFDLPERMVDQSNDDHAQALPSTERLIAIDSAIDKIEEALPLVRGLEMADKEMDELSDLAVSSYRDLTDLGMQVDSRFAAEIFSVASNMLGHAITAKTAKLDKKLKMIDLQLKKRRLDQQTADKDAVSHTGTGHILSRNELLERIIAQNQKPSNE